MSKRREAVEQWLRREAREQHGTSISSPQSSASMCVCGGEYNMKQCVWVVGKSDVK